MTDLNTDGAAAPDDGALFASVTSSEPETPVSSPSLEPAAPTPPPAAQTPPELVTPSTPEPSIPPARLREEAEARRNAERERDELRGRLTALEQRQQPQQPQQPALDPFDRMLSDPTALVREEAQQLVDPVTQQVSQLREFYSQRDAEREHGADKVKAAYDAMEAAIRAGDPDAVATYQRARGSLHPFGDIVKWHQKATVISQIGNDLDAYKQRIIDEALKNPDVQKRVLEQTRQQAQQNGNVITRPAVSALPSLNKVGSVALPDAQEDVSDEDLFRKTTSRKRA